VLDLTWTKIVTLQFLEQLTIVPKTIIFGTKFMGRNCSSFWATTDFPNIQILLTISLNY
jgi:hypothetical protein